MSSQSSLAMPGTLAAATAGQQDDGGGLSLRAFVQILRRRKYTFLAGLVVITGLQVAWTLFQRATSPVYEGGFTLMISDPVNNQTGNQSGAQLGGPIESLARNTASADVPTLIQVLQSQSVLGSVYEQLAQDGFDQSDFPDITVQSVRDGQGRQSIQVAEGILSVSGEGSNPEALDRALRLTEQAYLNWSTRQRQERVRDGLAFLGEQEPGLRAQNEELQRSLQRFREANTLVEPTAEAQQTLAQIESLKSRLQSQQGEQTRLTKLRSDVASGRLSARDFTIPGFVSQSGGFAAEGSATTASGGGALSANLPNQSLLDELQRVEQEIAVAEANFQPNSPILKSLKASRDTLLEQARGKQIDAVDAALEQNANAMATTQAQINRLERQFQQQPALLREYGALQQRLQIADSNLEGYLSTRESFQLEMAQQSTPWKVISPTQVGSSPVKPSLSGGLRQGLLFGLVGGLALALLRERMDHVFHTPEEVRQELNLPLLGHIPYLEFFDGVRYDKRFLLSELDQPSGQDGTVYFSTYKEALRNLYTNLRFLGSDQPLRSIGITSSLPSEGKSLLTVLLAKTLCEMGQRVLLVDADLRKPHIHYRLGLDNGRGLSTLLADEGTDWRELVQDVPDHAGWGVIPAGPLPPNPPRLLGSHRMQQVVQDIAASGAFDLILYDTAPAQGLADAALLSESLDGMVLVVSLSNVDRNLPTQALERLRTAGSPLLGIVTNARNRGTDDDQLMIATSYGKTEGDGRDDDDDMATTGSRRKRPLRSARRSLSRLGSRAASWLDR